MGRNPSSGADGTVSGTHKLSCRCSRRENTVLRRQADRVRYEPADRVWFAGVARLVPRGRWAEAFPICPATLLAWHRRLAGKKYDTSRRCMPGLAVC